jgi:hypothetical protein
MLSVFYFTTSIKFYNTPWCKYRPLFCMILKYALSLCRRNSYFKYLKT